MHELSVTESILNIAVKHANQAKARKVTDIYIVIGRLSSIVDESVQFYWDILTEDTICAASKLHFQRKEARFLCADCHNEFTLENDMMPCPRCGSIRLEVISGDEFFIDSIEIER